MPTVIAEITPSQAWGYLFTGAFGLIFVGILVAVGLEVVRQQGGNG